MTTATDTHALEIVRVLGAPPEIVFEAWSSAKHARRWWYPRQGGRDFECAAFEMDFRTGGAYRYCIRSPEGQETWAHGVYREIVPPHRLVFTFQWEWQPRPSEETLITVSFAPAGPEATRLTFRQEPFTDRALRDGHEAGWGAVLDHLAAIVAATRRLS
jgi:uncharacterized protein YndB with AHSA1/START domain